MELTLSFDGIDQTIRASIDCSFSPDRRGIPKPGLKKVEIHEERFWSTSDMSEASVREWVRERLADFIEWCARQYDPDG